MMIAGAARASGLASQLLLFAREVPMMPLIYLVLTLAVTLVVLAILAQLCAIFLQTLLNRVVVAQLLTAKTVCVSRARLLLLRGAHMALSQ